MIFRKKGIKSGAKKIDKLVTGLIIGGALASIFGASRTKKGKKITNKIFSGFSELFRHSYACMGKGIVGIIKFFQKK